MYSSDSSFSMVIDSIPQGREMSVADIQRFLDAHKQGFSSHDFMMQILAYVPVSVMLSEWLKTIKSSKTREKYKWAINRVFELAPLSDVLDSNASILTLDKNYSTQGVYNLISEDDAPEATIQVYRRVYSNFCDFVRVKTWGTIDPEESPKQKKGYFEAAQIYEKTDWRVFIDNLPKPFNLIGEMIFLSAKIAEYRLRVCDPRRNVLSLSIEQIKFSEDVIHFHADQGYHVTGISIRYPKSFMEKLAEYIGSRRGVAFLSPREKNLYPAQVQRAFKKASKSFDYDISPDILVWAGVIAHKNKQAKSLKPNPS